MPNSEVERIQTELGVSARTARRHLADRRTAQDLTRQQNRREVRRICEDWRKL
jgi:predicted transcriptional regulator